MSTLPRKYKANPSPLKTLRKISQGAGHPVTLPFVKSKANSRPKSQAKSLAITATLLLAALAHAQTPDTIFLHGNILTGAHLRQNDPSATPARVTAIAIANGKILAAGTDADRSETQRPEDPGH